jgi:general secretion pathway protein D
MKTCIHLFLLALLATNTFTLLAKNQEQEISEDEGNSLNEKKKIVQFDFNGKNLEDILIALAEFKKINIIIPTNLELSKHTVNFSLKTEIEISQLEEYFLYFLSLAGYLLTIQDNVYIVEKKTTDENLRRQKLPLYVNVPPEELPDNMSYIKVIYFLKHVKVPSPDGGSESIKEVLFRLLPDKQFGIMVDERTNSLLLTGPSNSIASALFLINEIDNAGTIDYVFSMPLEYTSIDYVMKLIESIIMPKNDPKQKVSNVYRGPLYFSPHIKIVPDDRQNIILFFGEKEEIDKLVAFIKTEIDIPLAEGTSTVHIYTLKHLDAKKMAPILQNLVNGETTRDQSTKEQSNKGVYKKFDQVRIIPEEVLPVKREGQDREQTSLSLGGNKLIISATEDDFRELSQIIERLDQPQPQLHIEMLILDLNTSDIKNFASNSGIPSFFNLPPGVNMQSIMMDSSRLIMTNLGSQTAITNVADLTAQTAITSNMLATIPSESGVTSLANTAARNGLILSLGEQYKHLNIWSLLQLEENISKRNVIENPSIITLNRVPAKIENVVVKRGSGELSPNNTQYGGATVVNIQSYTASLGIMVTPRISFKSESKRINLEINMAIEDFKNDINTDFTKYNRSLKTSANVASGDVLILGGLMKEVYSESTSKVPFIGDLPLVGALFRKKVYQKDTSNLYVLIRVIVVNSKEELDAYTAQQTGNYRSDCDENLLSNFIFNETAPCIDPSAIHKTGMDRIDTASV